MVKQHLNYLKVHSEDSASILIPYLPIFYTGYVIDGVFLVFIVLSMTVIRVFLTKPKFIVYGKNSQEDPGLINTQ